MVAIIVLWRLSNHYLVSTRLIQNETDLGKKLTHLCDVFNYDQGILTIFVIWM